MKTLRLLFGLRLRIGRAHYLGWGLTLAVLKFALDTGVVRASTDKIWSPIGYIVPSLILRGEAVGRAPEACTYSSRCSLFRFSG